MSHVPDPSNVVKLGERQESDQRGGELLRSVRTIAMARAQTLAGSLFENVDDALFDLAEKAENNTVQTQYFDGMREVRKKRPLIERMFVDHMNRIFDLFASGKPDAVASESGKRGAGAADSELALVDDRELEESLAVTSMISKAENRYARLLYSVNQRLSVICGGSKVDDSGNPIGPAAFARSFRLAMRELDADVKVKLIIYKLFERYVLAGLEPLYEAINIELVRAGVLPQLRHRAPRRGGSDADGDTSSRHTSATDRRGQDEENYDDEEHEAYREQLYSTVNSLLAQRRSSGGHVGIGGPRRRGDGASLPALTPADLLSAINMLQVQTPADDDSGDYAGNWSLPELKAALQAQIGKLPQSRKADVSGADEDTIDLVGMLFEYILSDRNLPPQMQALLGRLQIPYLKVAILDKHLFAKRTHPARRLLDAMADAAKGWSEESDRDLRLYNEIKNTVDELVRGFEDDLTIFDRLLARFEVFSGGNQQRANLAEQRAAEATRGREKLQAARRTAAREVLARTQTTTLPTLIQSILTRPWANYLVLTLLRQGEQSTEWRTALRFIDDLIASAQPLSRESDRQKLRTMLPGLETQLRHGLTTVAFHDTDVSRLMRALGSFYHTQLGGTAPDLSSAQQAAEQADAAVIPDAIEAIVAPVEPEVEADTGSTLAEDTPSVQQARALRVGNWVELVGGDEQRERAKLSWISPISGKYLFVNRRGLKVCDMTLPSLAASIDDGSTVVLEEVPLFDRALDAIVERLKTDQGVTAPKVTANNDDGPATTPE